MDGSGDQVLAHLGLLPIQLRLVGLVEETAAVIHGRFAAPHGTRQLVGGLVDVQYGSEAPIKNAAKQ
jgi:hypothetical protein